MSLPVKPWAHSSWKTGFDHRTSLRPSFLQVGSIGFRRGAMGVVAQIDEVLHAQIFANGMRMQMQLLAYLSLGPALRRESMHLLIHLQLPATLFSQGGRFAPWRLTAMERRSRWCRH